MTVLTSAQPLVRMPGVLRTPLSIYNAMRDHFPDASATVDVDGGGSITMTLNIPGIMPPPVFSKAVDTRSFNALLLDLFQRIMLDRAAGTEVRYALDPQRFSSEVQLQDWQSFRRLMFERSGTSCVDAIILYLQDQSGDHLRTLSSLGLAPEQIDRDPRERDLVYFRSIPNRIVQMREGEQDRVREALKRMFPLLFARILRERAENHIIDEIRGKRDLYKELLPRLRAQVVGQDLATHALAAELDSQTNQEENRVFLFIGPTGVGKTELAKAVSSHKKGLVTFEMEKYQNDVDVWRLFGSTSGLVGSTDKPTFSKLIDKFASRLSYDSNEVKNIVVLFDEFEKAHQSVKQSLLNLFSEGKCSVTYSTGFGNNVVEEYIFKSSIFICTSNLFQDYLLDCFYHAVPVEEIRKGFKQLNKNTLLPHTCSQELLGRCTIIPFGPIPRGECYQKLIKGKLTEFLEKFKKELLWKEIVVENEPAILQALENKLYDQGIDIRRVRRYIHEEIRGTVYKEKARWGDLKTKKLTLTVDPVQGLCFKIAVFDAEFKCYIEDFFIYRLA